MPQLPSSSAADADHAATWWRTQRARALTKHATRAACIASVLATLGSMASLYLSQLGWRSCDDGVCSTSLLYPLTVQRRSVVTTLDGARIHRTEWHPSGAVWIDGAYNPHSGDRVGPWVERYENGALRFEATYADDEIEGAEAWYFPNGKLEWSIARRHGVRDGEERWYHDNGALRRIGSYRNGERSGTFTAYDEDGNVSFTGEYLHGVHIAGKYVE